MVEYTEPKPFPISISCDSTNCERGRHSFPRKINELKKYERGQCKSCGEIVNIEWYRLEKLDTKDFSYTKWALCREEVRYHYWSKPFNTEACDYLDRLSEEKLRDKIRNRVRNSIGSARPFRDGGQTSMKSNNPIHWAQFATATCCRKCAYVWHGVEKERKLTKREIEYFVELIMHYIKAKSNI